MLFSRFFQFCTITCKMGQLFKVDASLEIMPKYSLVGRFLKSDCICQQVCVHRWGRQNVLANETNLIDLLVDIGRNCFFSPFLLFGSFESGLSFQIYLQQGERLCRTSRRFDENARTISEDGFGTANFSGMSTTRLTNGPVCHTTSRIGKRIEPSHLCHRRRETRLASSYDAVHCQTQAKVALTKRDFLFALNKKAR